ncbi:MAG: T9SS type A sorting domain-containing protein [Flavobacteriaceae bacterium]|jgi:photosystem II stability/assembly factor-like uncharacterized protein|nr:T9SS type A sorting domain-containing protein [Flavobacteriaceae bacterium]
MTRKSLILVALFMGMLTVYSQEYNEMIEAGTFTVQEIIDNGEAYFADRDKGKGTGYTQFKRWEYMSKRTMNEDGRLPAITDVLAEVESFNAYLNETSGTRQSLTDNWVDMGPDYWNQTTAWSPGVGRITGLAVDATNSDHIIVGAETGGVWRTIDAGATWAPMGDYFSNLRVYAVAIDPQDSDIYFFGSNGGFMYKSLDAGATWTEFADLTSTNVNKILIHPTDSDIIFASYENSGLKVTTDGGANWTSPTSDNRSYDVEFKPGDPSVVYASGNGVHKSIDGGATFTTIGGFSSNPKMMGVSADDDTIVYVVEASGGSFSGLYKSIDSGDSFTELDHTDSNYFGYNIDQSGGQAPRDMDITVSPINVDEVHIAGVLTYRSMDGGVSFEQSSEWIPGNAESMGIGYCHADVDILVFDGSTLYVGSDGGIFKTEDSTNLIAGYYTDITRGLGINQLYKIGVSQTADVVISGGSQDNGTACYKSTYGWRDWIGADGMETFIDKDNSDRMYGTSQFGQLYRSFDSGLSLTGITEPGSGQGNWVTPWEQDPVELNTSYLGYSTVYKSTSGGNSWNPASQNLGGNLDQLKIAQNNNQVLYASRGSILYKTEDAGATNWVQLPTPGGGIRSIAIHPTDPDMVAVATSSGNKVFVSLDGGATWINYKFNLPNFSSLAVVWDDNGEDGLYLGMDYGLFYIDNTFTEWQPYNTNLPNVIINELEINSVDGKIYAGTYGRGFWASPIVPHILNTESFLTSEDVQLYPNPATDKITLNFNKGAEADFSVFDVLGKLVIYQPNVSISQSHTIDVSKLNNGVYFVRINSDAGTTTKKMIKK